MKRENKYVLPVLTILTAVLAVLSIAAFTLVNRRNIAGNNREYLLDNTSQMAMLVDDSLVHGLANIQVLSNLLGEVLTSPEIDIASLQRILDNSIFDFIEFADREGWNHNITGGVSEAGDRRYYLDAMRGNSGVELIFNSRATFETLLLFYAPVRYQGEIIGSLIGAYKETNQLDKLLTMDVFGHKAEAYLCSEEGLIIASNQGVDTTAEISIKTILGPRIPKDTDRSDFIYGGRTAVIPLMGNETGACVMGLKNSDWYVIQVFPEEANGMMVARANRIGFVLAAFLVAILVILLILTYAILNRSRMEAQRAFARAEAASRAKTDFLFSMSHDIRTPMNAVIGFSRLLEKQQEDPARRGEYIRKIRDAGELLLSIINNVLEMSQLERGKAALEEAVWSAERLADSVCSPLAPRMREKGIAFEWSVEVRHPFIWCDAAKFQQACLNILNNACQYTPGGGSVSLRLTELPAEREGYALYKTEIQDTGTGISEEFLPHLFEAFSRERDTTHGKVPGTGLGMTIVKKLAELMGGSVGVESEAGRGTKVTLLVPHRVALEADVPGGGDGAVADPVFSGKRILLAEDNDLNAEIAAELLGELGFQVERAQDGDVCLSMLEQAGEGYYDLILMDIQMPNMDGYQAARAIREMDDPAKAGIPIAAMSANALEEDRERAWAAGMDAHLPKPADIQKLTETLTGLLQGL